MTSTALRQTALAPARRVVVKLGTQLLTAQAGGLDTAFMSDMAGQIARLRGRGVEVTLVSSGAIGAGCAELNLKSRPRDVAEQQAVAAVGQRRLMTHWHEAFAQHGLRVAQLLLTRSDFDDRPRFLNIRNCVGHLHSIGCVPIVNENDTVAVEEIRFGDNDLLAALMCNAVHADALVILSVVDGLLDADGQRIDVVENVRNATALDRKEKSKLGSGGMTTKLEAARLVTDAGEAAVVAHGRTADVLNLIFTAQPVGTLFAPAARKLASRDRWIGMTGRPAGVITVDEGASSALRQRGKSLLASGIKEVTGRFESGAIVLIRDAGGNDVARGLTNYSAEEARLIMGRKSSQFEGILGRTAFAEVVHRDNLVLLAPAAG
ncbi:MAG: glutamate 5-kinase [Planctomycetes bacterium]|nr:glutamate 5-kinase [Planctomycetota bacterium]